MLRRASKVMFSNLELAQALATPPPHILHKMLPCHEIILAQNGYMMLWIKNSLFSELDLLESLPWSVLSLEAMLLSVSYATAEGHAGIS